MSEVVPTLPTIFQVSTVGSGQFPPAAATMEEALIKSSGMVMDSECYNYQSPHTNNHPMSFLQMLQGGMHAEDPQQQPESNFELLLRLQQHHHYCRSWGEAEQHESCITHATSEPKSETVARKRRKRPRPAVVAEKKKAEVENQRLTHIAVERNRRRLMNEHLSALRALMPPSLVRRGDQASIVGGAIEFVKELEQHLVSLQAEKRTRAAASPDSSNEGECHVAVADSGGGGGGEVLVAPQYMSYSRSRGGEEGVDVEATVVQGHASVKVAGPRRGRGQLVRAVAAVEELRMTVLHLNVNTLDEGSVLYSLNLKMEDQCELTSADDIATAIHQIFTYIDNAC